MRRFLPLAILMPCAAFAGWGLGETIDPSLSLDVTASGFQSLGGLAGAIVPPSIPVDPITQADSSCIWLPFVGNVCAYDYSLSVSNIDIGLTLNTLDIEPKWDALEMYAQATVKPGSSANPIVIDADVEIIEFINFNQVCHAWVDPVTVELGGDILLDVVDDANGERVLDATIPPDLLWWNWDLSGQDLNFGGPSCVIADIEDFFDWLDDTFGINIFDMILDLVIPLAEDAVNDLIDDLSGEIEPQIEELFSVATIHEEIDLAGAPLIIDLAPSDVQIEPAGLRVMMEGSVDTVTHPCVAEYGIIESYETAGDLPPIDAPLGVPNYDVGIFVADDFVNQAMFGAWAGGVLCQRLTPDDGLPLTTTLLSLLSSDAFGELFPETQPMVIETRPALPPEARLDGPHTLDIEVQQLGVDFYTELDYRMTRVIGSEAAADAGIDMNFDDTTGQLAIDVALDPSEFVIGVTHNEYAPGFTSDIEDSFGGLIDAVVGPLIGGLISDLSFGLPAIEGIGLTSLLAEPAGPNDDFLALYANAGEVDYPEGSCDDLSGGCSGGGCAGVVTSPPVFVFLVPLLIAGLRRRDA